MNGVILMLNFCSHPMVVYIIQGHLGKGIQAQLYYLCTLPLGMKGREVEGHIGCLKHGKRKGSDEVSELALLVKNQPQHHLKEMEKYFISWVTLIETRQGNMRLEVKRSGF